MQSDVDRELNRDSSSTHVVVWIYNEHPSRWVVAVITFIYVIASSAELFSGNFPDIESPQFGGGHFVFTLIVVIVLLAFIVTSLRPRINGCLVRRGNQFELDGGRRAPDFVSALSFWSGWSKKPLKWFTGDLTALGSEYSARFFPRRHKIIGQINEIEGVTLETAVLGPKIILHLKGCSFTVAEDIPAGRLKDIYEEISGVLTPLSAVALQKTSNSN